MRVTSKGQVTIPLEIREKLGIVPQSEVEFVIQGNAARLMKVPARRGRGRGAAVIARLRGRASVSMTTDEIMALTRGSR
jgi:AbrB family looped-hinge helix DNA binding protein